jgi:hypothetical protein
MNLAIQSASARRKRKRQGRGKARSFGGQHSHASPEGTIVFVGSRGATPSSIEGATLDRGRVYRRYVFVP